MADLVAREQVCCSFLSFAIGVSPAGTRLDISGPAGARPLIEALAGKAYVGRGCVPSVRSCCSGCVLISSAGPPATKVDLATTSFREFDRFDSAASQGER
jgi:hypothetical protein